MNIISAKAPSLPDKIVISEGNRPESLGDKLWQGLDSMLKTEDLMNPGNNFSPKELLLLQVKASSYHLRVELVSKAAESLLATVRKFQNA